jgi:hypothetical protein
MRGPDAERPGDFATVSVQVGVAPADAFDVFTREIDLWWRRGPRFRLGGRRRGVLALEPCAGGRLFETFELPSGQRTVEVGRVTAWDPPGRLGFEWRAANFGPHETTFVEVAFATSGAGTLVTVRHRGWSAIPDDHPVRHGLTGAAFLRFIGLWWGDLMTSLREHVASSPRT